jgi:hypothetical protein
MSIDREMLLAYQKQWQPVAQIERMERQSATVGERWQRLNALLRLAGALALQSQEYDPKTKQSHERWNRLRSIYLEKQDA